MNNSDLILDLTILDEEELFTLKKLFDEHASMYPELTRMYSEIEEAVESYNILTDEYEAEEEEE